MQRRNLKTVAVQTYSDGEKRVRPLSVPIVQATTFQSSSSITHGRDFKEGAANVYTRFGHPTLDAVAQKIAQLEGAETALLFSSGMGAITTSLLSALRSGDHVVCQREVFAQTYTFLDVTCRGLGIETTFVNATDVKNIIQALRPNTKLIYIESPSNPVLDIVDIRKVTSIGDHHSIPVFIDSTFATPMCQRPQELGASLVLHSATKYLSGHADVMCGAVAGSGKIIEQIKKMQILMGTILDPHAAWLLLRGIKTLGVRMNAICSNALAIANFLNGQKGIKSVYYPFLQSSMYYHVAINQMIGGGGVVSFEVEGGLAAARKFVDALKLIPIATSLGGCETMIEVPYELDFNEYELGQEAMDNRNVPPQMIRLAVGIEDIDDLLNDLKDAISVLAN